jgi:hypothetical protein
MAKITANALAAPQILLNVLSPQLAYFGLYANNGTRLAPIASPVNELCLRPEFLKGGREAAEWSTRCVGVRLLDLARIAKIIAVLGFVLPWLAVSCSGHRMLTASGLSLAVGDMTIAGPGAPHHIHGHPNWWLAAAGAVIVAGLVAGLALRGRAVAATLLAASAAGAILSAVGLWSIYAGQSRDIATVEAQAIGVGRSGGLARLETLYGFWMTLIGLAASGGLSALVLTGGEGDRRGPEP